MIPTRLVHFREVWLVDTEFCAPPGDRPTPVCLVARELRGGAEVWLWEDDLRRRASAPYPTDAGSLIVAYYASAELGVHLALGWPLPCRVLDLYAEFRSLSAGLRPPFGSSLLGALLHHGLDAMGAGEKETMRARILRGGP